MSSASAYSFTCRDQTLLLHPQRAIFWSEQRALLLSDLHLGKAAHFRRAGIGVPAAVDHTDFYRLHQLLDAFAPERVLLLGDLFHSHYNHVWNLFCELTHQYTELSFELVPGNHDIMPPARYAEARLLLQPLHYDIGPFRLSHHPLAEQDMAAGSTYGICGHVHPCVQLRGSGGQRLRLPCFYFGQRQAILPAFGSFTGCGSVAVREGERVFVLADDQVVAV